MAASPALQIAPSEILTWRDALAGLKPNGPPCPGMTASHWSQVREAGLEALDQYADDFLEHSWTAAELFGVHPQIGTTRVDCCGALVISGRKVDAVSDDRISLGLVTFYRNVPGGGIGIPIWGYRW